MADVDRKPPVSVPLSQRTFDTYTKDVNALQAAYAASLDAINREYTRISTSVADTLQRALERASAARDAMESPVINAYRAGMDAADRAYESIAGPATDLHDTMLAQARAQFAARYLPLAQQLADDLDQIKTAYESVQMTAPPTG